MGLVEGLGVPVWVLVIVRWRRGGRFVVVDDGLVGGLGLGFIVGGLVLGWRVVHVVCLVTGQASQSIYHS